MTCCVVIISFCSPFFDRFGDFSSTTTKTKTDLLYNVHSAPSNTITLSGAINATLFLVGDK